MALYKKYQINCLKWHLKCGKKHYHISNVALTSKQISAPKVLFLVYCVSVTLIIALHQSLHPMIHLPCPPHYIFILPKHFSEPTPPPSSYLFMIVLCHEDAFHVTGPLWGESTFHWRIPFTKGQYYRVLISYLLVPEHAVEPAWNCWWFKTPCHSCDVTLIYIYVYLYMVQYRPIVMLLLLLILSISTPLSIYTSPHPILCLSR